VDEYAATDERSGEPVVVRLTEKAPAELHARFSASLAKLDAEHE